MGGGGILLGMTWRGRDVLLGHCLGLSLNIGCLPSQAKPSHGGGALSGCVFVIQNATVVVAANVVDKWRTTCELHALNQIECGMTM